MGSYFKKSMGVILIFSLLILAACSGGANKTTTGGTTSGNKTMYIGMVNPPAGFNPINSSDLAAQFLEKFMFDTFLEMDKPLHFVPKLADSIDTTDSQTFTIKLNKDAKWTDGKPVTAEDVEFTFNLIANPKVETAVGGNISTLEGLGVTGKLPEGQSKIPSLKVVDDHTVQFKTKQPVDSNYIKEMIGTKIITLPKHVLKDIAPDKLAQAPFMQKPTVSSGPFNFENYKKDQYVEYSANADYYLGKPKLQKLFVKIMAAPNLVAQLQTGEIHMNSSGGNGGIAAQDLDTVKKIKNVNTEIQKSLGFQTMQFNTKTIKDPKVRKAIVYALDRQQIVDKLLRGNGEVIDGPYTSVSPYLDKSLKPIPYEPEKAKQMLKDAGWDFNKPIRFVVPIGNKVREQSANIIAENLKAVGLKVETTTYDFPTIMQKGKAGDFDLLLIGFTLTLDPDYSILYGLNGTYNFMKYDSPKSEELLNQAKVEPDQAKRKAIYFELQKIWDEDVPIITLYSPNEIVSISKNVTYGGPKLFGTHYNLQKWDLSGAK
ncbi:ABC transporter substrate-binding protein [Bacillota bacterium Lsc_1132]